MTAIVEGTQMRPCLAPTSSSTLEVNPLHQGVVDTKEFRGAALYRAAARMTADDTFVSVRQR